MPYALGIHLFGIDIAPFNLGIAVIIMHAVYAAAAHHFIICKAHAEYGFVDFMVASLHGATVFLHKIFRAAAPT